MAEGNNDPGGHTVDFVKPLDARYKCPICIKALRTPYQTSCGHRYCESCVKNLITNGDQKCPEDGTVLSLDQIFRDAFCNREILELECYCTNKNLGCKWTGLLRAIEEHKKECMFVELECLNEGCNVTTIRRLLEEHMKNECKFKKISCYYCGEEKPEPLMEDHTNTTCPKFPLLCQKGCGEKVPRADMEKHVKLECSKAESTCPLVGQCDFKGSRGEIRRHMMEKLSEHTLMINDRQTSLQFKTEKVETLTATLEEKQQALQGTVNNYREELVTFRDDLATLRAKTERYENRENEVLEGARAAKEPRGAERPDELEDIKRRLEKLEEQMNQIQVRERHTFGRGQVNTQNAGTNQGETNEAIAELERRLAAMEHQNTLSDVQMADHDVKISMLETTSYDGEFLWKIDDFSRRLQDAIAGRCLSIYSPQFYVGRYGYKVCVRVYLNGDGMGKGTHLSLFFVVMRGAYDALLSWPFQQKVSFKLIDQTEDQHIVDSFRPDPNSSSFQRPRSNMNIASGCPLFVPKTVLHTRGYIKDDTVFFKISVDTTGLSRL